MVFINGKFKNILVKYGVFGVEFSWELGVKFRNFKAFIKNGLSRFRISKILITIHLLDSINSKY
jgi:hypothetical protein